MLRAANNKAEDLHHSELFQKSNLNQNQNLNTISDKIDNAGKSTLPALVLIA